ncbi:MAG: micrococcal nuclease [Planctomycetota bacterium]|jgi:micrococcal nuclease
MSQSDDLNQHINTPILARNAFGNHALALGLAITMALTASCGDSEAKDKAIEAAQKTAELAQVEAGALADSVNAGVEAAKAAHGNSAAEIEAARDSAMDSIGDALDAATSVAEKLFAGTRADFVSGIESKLEAADVEITALKASLAGASDEAQITIGFSLAALDAKRSLVTTKLAKISEAGEDAWQVLAPTLEEKMESVNKALATVQERLDQTLEEESAPKNDWLPGKPKQLFDVVKVVDGDTIHITRNGEKQKLRLLSVDTEEKLSGREFNPSKPETLFGEETKLWAIDFFNALANEDGVIQVGVIFPAGEEAYDVYGRLLCHVVLPDGTDFNLKLVEEGWSPYFTKYGYSRICNKAFLAAEAEAKKQQLGIWNPEVNKPASESEPWNKRDYDAALPWWRARGDAIEEYRNRAAGSPETFLDAENEDQLAGAVEAGNTSDYPKSVFGAVDRSFEESDGSLTLLFRTSNDKRAFRAKISAELRPKLKHLNLENRGDSGVQNYLFVTGKVVDGPRGFDIHLGHETALTLGAPDPVFKQE